MRLGIVTYNPMHAGYIRLTAILLELSSYGVILLSGTARRTFSNQVEIFQCNGYTCCCFGHVGKNKHSNKSCGCMIAIKISSFANIHTVYEPDEAIRGRAGAIRITRADVDILLISLYFPPDAGTNVSTTSQLIAKWVRKIVGKVGNRCTVIFGGDPNAKAGIDKDGLQYFPHIGVQQPDKENTNGTIFRELMCDLHLTAVNTH
jgi:hypothetical protein